MPSAGRVRWAKFRIMATAAAGLLILATLIALLTGGRLLQPESLIYVYVPDGTGIAQGSPVRVDGIDVGKVEEVGLSGSAEPNRVVKVTMRVRQTLLASITADSTAQPEADTLVGDKFIQITTGKSPQRIQPGSEVSFQGSSDLMTSIDLTQFRRNLDQMDAVLTDIETARSPLGEFIVTDDMYRDLVHRVAELESGVRAAASTTSSIGHELYTDALYRQVEEPIQRIDLILAQLQSGQGTMGRFLQDNAQYDQWRGQIADLHKSIVDLRGSEFLRSDAAYDSWNRMLPEFLRKVEEFNATPALLRTDVYDNINGSLKELQGALSELRQDPRKFLRLKVF